eukprot:gb/GFBE01051064.1/.p3 GENE.gb/GFBE01051064.1/~~gb/GFBE01051064.1/.p3  ORF type:complete len:101 (+),score=14.32 gb/GFBE01051064.1/:177-479(+)
MQARIAAQSAAAVGMASWSVHGRSCQLCLGHRGGAARVCNSIAFRQRSGQAVGSIRKRDICQDSDASDVCAACDMSARLGSHARIRPESISSKVSHLGYK